MHEQVADAQRRSLGDLDLVHVEEKKPFEGDQKEVVEMGESRTPRPEPFAGDHYERVRWFVVDRPNGHRHPAGRSSHVPLDRA
jgi:hypothetical protein